MLKIILPFLFVPMPTHANGHRVGNGGTGFVCEKNSKRELRVLDLTEMSAPIEKSIENQKREVIVSKVLENLNRLAPVLGKQYSKRFAEFDQDIEFHDDVDLTATKDTNHIASPKNCKLQQVVIRRDQVDSVSKRFVINRDLWDLAEEKGRAALTVHEIVYEHFAKLGEKDSVKARKVTGYLLSEKAFKDEPEAFWKLIRELKLPIYR